MEELRAKASGLENEKTRLEEKLNVQTQTNSELLQKMKEETQKNVSRIDALEESVAEK